jgi:hypothetical protein
MLVNEPKSSKDPALTLLWELDLNISMPNIVNGILFLSNLAKDAADMACESMSL